MKKIISLFLALIMMLSVTAGFTFTAQAKVDLVANPTGSCGTDATYTFDSETGLLTISGKGRIKSSAFYRAEGVNKVVIQKGITKIGDSAFKWSSAEDFVLPDGIIDIELHALDASYVFNKDLYEDGVLYNNGYMIGVDNDWYDHGNIPEEYKNFKIKKGTVLIAAGACQTVDFKSVEIPNTVKYIGQMAFDGGEVSKFTIPTSVTNIYDDSFFDTGAISDVYFKGSKSDLKKIKAKNAYSKKSYALTSKSFKNLFGAEYYDTKFTVHYAKVSAPVVTSLKKIKKGFTIRWKKRTGAKGYQVQYATNRAMTKNKKLSTVKGNKTFKKTVKNLKGKKAYYVRMRSYKFKNGKKVYSSWSDVKKITTK